MIGLKDTDMERFKVYWHNCIKDGGERKIDRDASYPAIYIELGGKTMAAAHFPWGNKGHRIYVDQGLWDEFQGVDPDRVIIKNCTVEVSRSGNTPLLKVSTTNDNHIQMEVSPAGEDMVFQLNAMECSSEREKDFCRHV